MLETQASLLNVRLSLYHHNDNWLKIIKHHMRKSWSVKLILNHGSPRHSSWIYRNLYGLKKRPYIAVTVTPISLKKGTSLFPPINMSFLFSHFPQSFNFSIFLLAFGRLRKNVSITPALAQSRKTTFWLLSFQHHVFPFTWTEYTTLWNTFETLISPRETTPPPPNSVWSLTRQFLYYFCW